MKLLKKADRIDDQRAGHVCMLFKKVWYNKRLYNAKWDEINEEFDYVWRDLLLNFSG